MLLKADIKGSLSYFKCCQAIKEEIGGNVDFSRYEKNLDDVLSDFNHRFQDFAEIQSLTDIYFFPMICPVADQPQNLQIELAKLQQDIRIRYNLYGTEKVDKF